MYRLLFNPDKTAFVKVSEKFCFDYPSSARFFRDHNRKFRDRVLIYYDYFYCLVNRLQLIQFDALRVNYYLCEVSNVFSTKTKKSLR